jgi:hypothetical protein
VDVTRFREDADGEFTEKTVDALPTFFPGKKEVPVDWYTGALLIPRGKVIEYVHMGYGSTYERYLLLVIRAGKLVDRQEMTAEQLEAHRRRMFEAYKSTPEYARRLAEATEGGTDTESAEHFLYEYESANYLSQPLPH